MPNHIRTTVEIMGDKEKLAELIEKIGIKLDADTDENKFDFNAIIPMPKGMDITSGSDTDLGLLAFGKSGKFSMSIEAYTKIKWFQEEFPGVTTAEEFRAALEKSDSERHKRILELGRQASENLEKHGHATWYEWCNENWGTKWNAYDVKYIAHDDNHLAMEISTAWATPEPIWDKLREMGFEVNGIVHGEMEGTDMIGNGGPFYVETVVEFSDYFSDYNS